MHAFSLRACAAMSIMIAGLGSAYAEDVTNQMPRVEHGRMVNQLPSPPPPPSSQPSERGAGFTYGVSVPRGTEQRPLPSETAPGLTYKRTY